MKAVYRWAHGEVGWLSTEDGRVLLAITGPLDESARFLAHRYGGVSALEERTDPDTGEPVLCAEWTPALDRALVERLTEDIRLRDALPHTRQLELFELLPAALASA